MRVWLAAACAALAVAAAASRLRPVPPARLPAGFSARIGAESAPQSPENRSRWRGPIVVTAVGVGVVVGGPLIGLTVAIGGILARPLARRRAARRVRAGIAADLPDAIDVFVLAIGAGLTPRDAVGHLAERAPPSLRPAFAAVVTRIDRGAVLGDALRILDERLGAPVAPFTALVGSAARTGVPLTAVLERLAAESRATRRRLDEAAARALPVRLAFPLVVCTLPSFVLLAIVPAVLAALSSLGADAW